MKAKIYIGAKKYALYIGRKIVEKTLEFLTLPARFVSKKVQDLKNYLIYGNSVQDGTPTPTVPIEIESVGDRTKNLSNINTFTNTITDTRGFSCQVQFRQGITVTSTHNFSKNLGYNSVTLTSNGEYDNIRFKHNGSKYDIDIFILNISGQIGDTYTLSFVLNSQDTTVIGGLNLSNIQLEEGDEATPYEPYGKYKVPVKVSGENLFDGEWEYGNIDANGDVIISTSPSPWVHGKNRIKVKPNTRYWFRFFGEVTRTNAQFYIIGYDKDDKFITGKRTSIGAIIINLDGSYFDMASNVEYIRLFYYHNVEESTSLDTDRYKLSIEERNNIIPSYEPYITPTITNIYINEPLRKINEYADTLSVEGNNVTVTRNVEKELLKVNGVPSRTLSGYSIARNDVFLDNAFTNIPITVASDYFAYQQDTVEYVVKNMMTRYLLTRQLLWCIPQSILGTTATSTSAEIITSINNWATVNNVLIYHPLATPTTETYTIDNPIQLEQGTLTIDTDTKIKPSKIILTGDIDNE